MTTPRKVGVLVGSLRKDAFSRKVAGVLKSLAPTSLLLDIIEIRPLPLYDPDLDDAEPPAPWAEFRRAVGAVDAVLFVTPEYNRSVPAALKNALDVGSRPYGANIWAGKPGAVVSVSPGALGGFGANHHLRQSLVFLDVPTLQQPEVYLGHVDRLFDTSGDLTEAWARDFLIGFLVAYAAWIETNPRR